MGYPYDPASSFIRDPKHYPHDAFGADTGGRTMPHSGTDISPKKRGDTSAPVLAPISGEIIRQGFDREAGNYQIIAGDDGRFWGLGHHSVREVRGGRVERGDRIARMGATGGAFGVHVHIWVATNLDAAERIVVGYVNYRKGRTVAQWAASMGGLVDPYPLIVAQWADAEREAVKAAAVQAARDKAEALAKQGRDDDMIVIKNSKTGHIYAAGQQFLRHETYQPAGYRTAKLLTAQGEIVDLSDGDFREVLNALGIPLAAEDAVLEGKLWSPHAGVVDARTLTI